MKKKCKLKLMVFLFVSFSGTIHAQIAAQFLGNESRDHSKFNPNNYFMNYHDQVVDLSTGAISQTFDLYNLKGRTLEVPIKLVYKGSGNKVQDIPGIVGLGFDLIAGGYIKREVRHIADESKIFKKIPGQDVLDLPWDEAHTALARDYYNIPVAGQNELFSGWVDYASHSVSNWPVSVDLEHTEGSQVAEIIDEISNNTFPDPQTKNREYIAFLATSIGLGPLAPSFVTYDNEPDVFHFNLNGITGTFVFDKEGYPHTIPEQDIKIEPAIGPHGGENWIFTIADGTKFIFINTDGYRENITVISDNTPLEDDWHGYTPKVDESKHKVSYVNTWLLSAIQSPTGEEVKFLYDYDIDLVYTKKNSVRLDYFQSTAGFPQTGMDLIPDEVEYERSDVIRLSSKKFLKSISTTQGTATFEYDNLRDDIASGAVKLTNLKIINTASATVKQFKFNYDYFISSGICSNASQGRRLKLKSFKEITNGDFSIPATEFLYEEAINLPCWGSVQEDYWGYYNNNTFHNRIPSTVAYIGLVGRSFPAADRSADAIRTKANILTEVVWPTTGRTQFNYELNQYFNGSSNVSTGGLRIAEVVNYPTANMNDGMKKKYFYTDVTNVSRSSGTAHDLGRQYEIQRYWKNIGDYNSPDVHEYAYYVFRTSDSKYSLYLNEPVRYSWVHVEEQDLQGTSNGRTSFSFTDFTTNPDIGNLRYYADFFGINPYNFDKMTPTPAPPPTTREYERGIMNGMFIFDKNNVKIQETKYNYNFEANSNPQKVLAYWADSDDKFFYWGEGVWSYNVEVYSHDKRRAVLDNIIVKNFNQGNEMVQNTTFTYHPVYKSLPSSVTEEVSNGTYRITSVEYAVDAAGVLYDEIREKFLIDKVIKKEVWKGGKKITGEKRNYEKFNNFILPSNIERWDASTDGYVKVINFVAYDDFGNVIQQVDNTGIASHYKWVYNVNQPIAALRNASSAISSFFHNGFEIEEGNSTESKTGFKSRSGGYSKILDGISNGDYVLTYWLRKTDGTWSIQNKQITVAANLYTINIPSNEHVDDIRFYPKGMSMITNTYAPLIGVTSETDMNNNITYYEYDNFGRISLIKDSDNNILKKYEYNYQIKSRF